MSDDDFSIQIQRAGQHPYMPGKARFSTWVVIAVWMFTCVIFFTQVIEITPRALLGSIIVMCLGIGALWGVGVWLARKNPFHQEIMIRALLRMLWSRTELDT